MCEWPREKVRKWLQELREAEVTEFLGRARYERKAAAKAVGYRNGYGKLELTLFWAPSLRILAGLEPPGSSCVWVRGGQSSQDPPRSG